MKKIITCLIIMLTFISTTDMTFAKKASQDKTTQTEQAAKEKTSKDKTTKAEKKAKEKTTKVEKAAKEKTSKDKTTKAEKKAKEKTTKAEQAASAKNTTIEKTRNRSALSMYLNPNLDVQEIRASHILVKKRKDALQIRKDIINGDITFEDAAKEYSLCPTGVKGGDLGYFNRKRMDQYFADRAFDLKVGEISEPVGTKFGWHLIKVVDKR